MFHKCLIQQTNTGVFTKNESVHEIDHDTPMFTFVVKGTEPSPLVNRHCEDPGLLRSEVYGPLGVPISSRTHTDTSHILRI